MATYTKEKDVETVLEDDIEARNTMQEVFSNTARWPAEFGGFAADVVANINGEEQKGTVTVKGPKDITISIEEENIKNFLNENRSGQKYSRPKTFRPNSFFLLNHVFCCFSAETIFGPKSILSTSKFGRQIFRPKILQLARFAAENISPKNLLS